MKVDTFKKEIAQLNEQELREKLETTRRDLFSLKLNATTAHIKDYSLFKKLRKDVARMLTHLHQKRA